jgi:hypothetical protein
VDGTEYWRHLEFRICRELAGMREKNLRAWWCDGFIPELLDATRGCFTGRVWMAHGKHQEAWHFTLVLGPHLRACEQIDWGALVVAEDLTGWLSIDPGRKTMTINPQAAYPEGGHNAWLAASTAALRSAGGNGARVAQAVRGICDRGRREILLPPLAVWDYLAVSWPGLFGDAGYSAAEVEQLMPVIEKAWAEAFDGWSPAEGVSDQPPAK